MILSDKDILKICGQGCPLIEPFDEGRLRGASYDISLDGEITPLRSSSGVIDIADQSAVDSLYQQRIPIEGFVMKPGQYCLAALAETITLPDDVVAFVVPRTRFTRMGLLIADQFCNPSYVGRLWIGLYNASGNNLRLTANMPIAQLVFYRLASTPSDERLYRNQESAVYQNEDSFIGGRAEGLPTEGSRRLYEAILSNVYHRGEQ